MHTPRNHAEGDQSHSCLPEPRTHKHLFFLLNPTAFSGDPRAVPVHCRGAAAAQRAGKQLGTGGHASCRTSCRGGACAPGIGAWTGGDPSKVAASVFCTATLSIGPTSVCTSPGWQLLGAEPLGLAWHANGRAARRGGATRRSSARRSRTPARTAVAVLAEGARGRQRACGARRWPGRHRP